MCSSPPESRCSPAFCSDWRRHGTRSGRSRQWHCGRPEGAATPGFGVCSERAWWRKARNLAEDAFYTNQERTKEEIKSLISYVQLWAIGKNENRDAWCQALHRIVSNGEGTGSILVFAFPQELVNKVAERTGGKPVRVRLPRLCEGFIDVDSDGRSFLVEPIRTGPNQAGVKRTYLFTYRDRKYSAEDIPDQELAPQEANTPGQDQDTVQ